MAAIVCAFLSLYEYRDGPGPQLLRVIRVLTTAVQVNAVVSGCLFSQLPTQDTTYTIVELVSHQDIYTPVRLSTTMRW